MNGIIIFIFFYGVIAIIRDIIKIIKRHKIRVLKVGNYKIYSNNKS
jgi:hypothetical protein